MGVHPLNCTGSTVAGYLLGMFEGRDQPAMVKVLRSSILSVLVLSSRELQISLVFSADCGASSVADFGSIGFCPKFDKIWCCGSSSGPFTNQDSSSDRDVPLDVVVCEVAFLLALACVSRAGEMLVFSRAPGSLLRERKQGGGTVLSIRVFPGFLA